ncbi:MAG: PAS domain S-box protein [Candidatus Thermoplasmatota archaeon]|nr:PAS domain S-box protein [Candidatus Thermoplasmatota archaeon]
MVTNIDDIFLSDELEKIVTNPAQYKMLSQLFYQGSYDLMLIIDKLGKLITINDAGLDFSGFQRNEVYGTHFLKIPGVLNKNEFRRCLKVYTDAVRGKPTFDFKTYLVNKDGIRHTMIFNVLPIKEKNKVKYILLIARDITEQVQNKRLFREANQMKTHLNNIIESTSEIIFSLDMNNRITTWNNAMISLSGISQSKVLDRKINSIDAFINQKEFLRYVNQVKKGYMKTFDELILSPKSGMEKLLSVSGSIIRDSDGDIDGVIFIGRDVTGEKILHDRLLPGSCYVYTGDDSASLSFSFNDLINEGYHGLIITRDLNNLFSPKQKNHYSKTVCLGDKTYEDKHCIQNSKELLDVVQEHIRHYKKTIILFTRIDYLFIYESFNSVLKNLYRIAGQVRRTHSILLLHLNTKLLSEKEQEFIMQEFEGLPLREVPDISLNDSMYAILEYLDKQKKMNLMVTFKKLGKELGISKSTVGKRVKFLERHGLVHTVKMGRSKSISLTDRGGAIINKVRNEKRG